MTKKRGAEKFWAGLAASLLHPVQLHIIEAMRWMGRPLSASELVRIFGGEQSLATVAYHVRRLVALEALKPAGQRPVRGAMEKFYRLGLADE